MGRTFQRHGDFLCDESQIPSKNPAGGNPILNEVSDREYYTKIPSSSYTDFWESSGRQRLAPFSFCIVMSSRHLSKGNHHCIFHGNFISEDKYTQN